MKLIDVLEHLSQQKIAGSKKAGVDLKVYMGDELVAREDDKFSGVDDDVGEDKDVLDNPSSK